MPRKDELTAEQNERLRAIIKRELIPVIRKQTDLAVLVGLDQSWLSKFLDGHRGSYALAVRVALLLDRPIEDVLGIGDIKELSDAQRERYPSRLFAVRAAYLEGVSHSRIRAILTSSLRSDGDPGVRAWMKMMRENVVVKPGTTKDTEWALELVRPGRAKRSPKQPKKR